MEDDLDRPEPTRIKAERRWSNHSVGKDFKKRRKEENEAKAKAEFEPKLPQIAEMIKTEKPTPSKESRKVERIQSKFVKEIKAMLDHHTKRNILLYKLSLQHRLKRLKYEKLKRLQVQAAQQEQEAPMSEPRLQVQAAQQEQEAPNV